MFYVNLYAMIPMSIYITIELVRFLGTNFIEWD